MVIRRHIKMKRFIVSLGETSVPGVESHFVLRTKRARIPHRSTKQKEHHTATCDKAGLPNDACPYGQVMSASPNDVAYGNDVVPSAQ